MSIREFQTRPWDGLSGNPKEPREDGTSKKMELSASEQARLRRANEYFDNHPPRASSPAEIAEFLKNF